MGRQTKGDTEYGHRAPRGRALGWKARCAIAGLLLASATHLQAQTCPAAPSRDVVLFLDNSGSITDVEFDAAQQAIASIATSILSRPGYRLAVVNWACTDGFSVPEGKAGCRIDLATATGADQGWYTTASSFAYAGNNSASNRVCRSFGGALTYRNNCGAGSFTAGLLTDFAQHALKMLDARLYAGGGTGGNDSYNQPTVGPGAPMQPLMIIHMTDGAAGLTSRIAEVPDSEVALGNYYYSNYLKNQRNALIVGVGIDATSASPTARQQLGALSSKGGSSTDYDTSHASAASTQAYDTGTPRLATFAATYNAAQIVAAANDAINATVPACVILRKQTVDGYGSFDFTGGTNGLPASLTRVTSATDNPSAGAAYGLTRFNTDTSISETVPSGWQMTGASCINASSVAVPGVTLDPAIGRVTIPAAQITSGVQLTCTVTNQAQSTDVRVQKSASPTTVLSGGVVDYTLVVTNGGPSGATNVQLLDTPSAGQDCMLPSSTATCVATGGASCPSATVPVNTLQGSGITLPSVPMGGQVTVALQCTVTASGL